MTTMAVTSRHGSNCDASTGPFRNALLPRLYNKKTSTGRLARGKKIRRNPKELSAVRLILDEADLFLLKASGGGQKNEFRESDGDTQRHPASAISSRSLDMGITREMCGAGSMRSQKERKKKRPGRGDGGVCIDPADSAWEQLFFLRLIHPSIHPCWPFHCRVASSSSKDRSKGAQERKRELKRREKWPNLEEGNLSRIMHTTESDPDRLRSEKEDALACEVSPHKNYRSGCGRRRKMMDATGSLGAAVVPYHGPTIKMQQPKAIFFLFSSLFHPPDYWRARIGYRSRAGD